MPISHEDGKGGNVDLDKLDMRSIEEVEHLKDRGDVATEDDAEDSESKKLAKKASAKPPAKKAAPAKKEQPDEDDDESDDEDDESDDEDEADDESEEGDEEDEAEGGNKSKGVPYKRFQQVNQARRAAEEKLAAVEAKLARQATDDLSNKEKNQARELNERIDKLYVDVEKARATGEYAEAAKLQRELDNLRNNISVAQSRYLARQESIRAAQESAYDAAVTQLETVEPRFDPDSDEFDERLVSKLDKLCQRLEKSGTPGHDALREAAELVLGYNPFKARPEKKAAKEKGDDAQKKRKEDGIRRNASTSKKQPPEGGDNFDEKRTKIVVRDLSDDEYDALPESKKRQLRGDFA